MVKVRGGGVVRGARGQVEKEPPDSASNRRKLPSQPIVVEQSWPTKRERVTGSRRKTSQWLEQFGAETKETAAGITGTEEIAVELHTIKTEETKVVFTEETDVQVHTVETEETKDS
ncbi:hypothetical protein ZWY2020_003562 [Hordeum vulgare]|nr:hypothetical protein ZWY2020_003562 [Hordeum vulgare]